MTPFHIHLFGPQRGPINSSFEDAERRLKRLPLLHFEPDGSFVWIREAGAQQIYGMLYDAANRLRYCDLQGHCTYETWCELRDAIATSQQQDLEVMLLAENVLQDLQTFEERLQNAASPTGGKKVQKR